MRLTTTPSREVAQMLATATSKRGLNREARAALFRVRTRPECPEDNMRERAAIHGVANSWTRLSD